MGNGFIKQYVRDHVIVPSRPVTTRNLEERGPELDAVRAVVDPGPARLDELAGGDHCGMADEGDEIALATGFDTQHAEAVVGVMEGDAVDQSRQDLRRARRQRRCHPKVRYASV